MLIDLTLQAILFRALALAIIAAVQGGAVAGAAVLQGDAGPRHDGRLTIGPLVHVDVLGAAALILFGLGWTRPVEIDPREMRTRRLGLALAVLAGAVALAVAAAALTRLVPLALTLLPLSAGLVTAAFLRNAAALCLWTGLFNLLPLPPLTGGHLLAALGVRVPERLVWLCTVAVLLAVASGLMRDWLAPAYAPLARLILEQG